MPSFGDVALPNINPLASYGTALQNQFAAQTLPSRTQIVQNTADSGTQDLTDRATLRGLAQGLATRDPNAIAGAAVLPAGVGTVTSLSGSDAVQAQIAAERAKLLMLQPDTSGPAVGGAPGGPAASTGGSPDVMPGLSSRESGDDPGQVNSAGYSGMFQHGTARLADIGLYTPAKGESLATNQWQGTLNIPGFPEVKTQADFLKSPGAQRAALGAEVANTDAAIAATPGADKFDVNGLRAVAHLGGVAGMQKFVATGGTYNPADSNGTHLSDYYGHFAKGGAPALQASFGHKDGAPLPDTLTVAQPGMTLAPGGAPAPAPGPQTASRGPMPGDTATDATAAPAVPFPQPGDPVPGTLGQTVPGQAAAPVAGTQGVDDVMARLRAGQPSDNTPPPGQPSDSTPPPSGPVHTGPLADMAPAGPISPAPANGLAGSGPTFMPAASAQPPAPVAPAQPAPQPKPVQPPPGGIGSPPPGSVMLRQPITHLPWPGAQPGNAFFKTPDGSVQQFRDPGQPQTLTSKDSGDQRRWYTPAGVLDHVETIPDKDRQSLVEVPGGHQMFQDGKPVPGAPIIPYSGRPEQVDAYKADLPKVEALTTAAQSAQAAMPRLNEMATLAGQLATGPTAELRAKGAAMLEAAGASTEAVKRWTGMESGAAAQEFVKLAISTAGSAAKADVGSNNGIQSMQLYQAANPNLSLLPDANKRITNMMRVSAQSIQDYAQGALQHFGPNEASLQAGGPYTPLTTYNRQWLGQSNPQVYAAATGILNGDSFDKWSSKISPAEAARAAQIAARIDPTVQVPMKGGGLVPVSRVLSHPAITSAPAPAAP